MPPRRQRRYDSTVSNNVARLHISKRASSATGQQHRARQGVTASAKTVAETPSLIKRLSRATEAAEQNTVNAADALQDDRELDQRVNDSTREAGKSAGNDTAQRTSRAVQRHREQRTEKKHAARRDKKSERGGTSRASTSETTGRRARGTTGPARTSGPGEAAPAGSAARGKTKTASGAADPTKAKNAAAKGSAARGRPGTGTGTGPTTGGSAARTSKHKAAATAAKTARLRPAVATGRYGPRFVPHFAPRLGGSAGTSATSVVNETIRAGGAAASAAAHAVAAIIGTKLAIAFAVILAVVLVLILILSAIPGMGRQAEQEEQASCFTGSAPVAADIDNLPVVAGFTAPQITVGATIAQTAQEAGLGREAQLVGLITAMQESDLGANPAALVPNSDGDAGPFQQRTLNTWYGSPDQVLSARYASEAFFLGVTAKKPGDYGSAGGGEGYGHLPGLVDINGWESLQPTEAAQAVQRSAYPDAYAPHLASANVLLNALDGTEVDLTQTGIIAACAAGIGGEATGQTKDVVAAAQALLPLGLTYRLGAGDQNGPSGGSIDCSSLTSSAWKAGAGIDIGRSAQDQRNNLAAYNVLPQDIQPGDLIFEAWGRLGPIGDSGSVSHVAMYIGNGQMIEASRSRNGPVLSAARLKGPQFIGISRPPSQETESADNA